MIGRTGLYLSICALTLGLARTGAAQSDVVLYSSDVTTTNGNWFQSSDDSAAGGQFMASAANGNSFTDAPLASPNDYFEASFNAPANTPFHVWLRMRATNDSKYSDSVWVQFSDATDTGGSPLYAIGSGDALSVNLEACDGCGDSGWGWQDHAYWLEQPTVVQFASSGSHTIRVQVREDGVQVDQIVLSAGAYLWSPPGSATDDWTVLPESLGSADGGSGGGDDGSGSDAGAVDPVVVTWNLDVDEPGYDGPDHASAAMDYIASMSPLPQIVIVEEALQSQFNTYINELQNRTGLTWRGVFATHCASGGWNGGSCSSNDDEGVGVFTSLPIADSSTTYLPFADEWHSARAVARAAINVGNRTVQVFAAHMSNTTSVRYSMMATLVAYAQDFPSPQIVGGDFNADPDQIDQGNAMGAAFQDAWASAGSGPGYTCTTPDPTMHLDYLFGDYSGRVKPVWISVITDPGAFSDHFPVLGSFTLR